MLLSFNDWYCDFLPAPGTEDLIPEVDSLRGQPGDLLAFLLHQLRAFIARMMDIAMVFDVFVAKIGIGDGEFLFTDDTYGRIHGLHLQLSSVGQDMPA